MKTTRPRPERVIWSALRLSADDSSGAPRDSLDELAELARAAGATVVEKLSQRLDRPTQTYLEKVS